MENFYFDTDGFRDPPDKIRENINEIGGFGLAVVLQSALTKKGFKCEEVFAEDYGWAFEAALADIDYFCTTSVDPVEETEANGFGFFANINVDKRRSLIDKFRGRNKLSLEDLAIQAVAEVLNKHRDVKNLKSSLF